MRIYLSGPITGTDDYMERFNQAQEKMEKKGWEVINPAVFGATLPGMTWTELMEVDIALIKNCDAIYMMKGWENSIGASEEHYLAQERKIKIIYESEEYL